MLKTKTITIPKDGGGRDGGKTFVLTEMPAEQAEWWGIRGLNALARSGQDVPDEIRDAGLQGLAIFGFKSLFSVKPEDLKPLLDEMMGCVEMRPDPKHPDIVRPLVEGDIEEVATRLRLRSEVIELHVGFSIAGYLSRHLSGLGK